PGIPVPPSPRLEDAGRVRRQGLAGTRLETTHRPRVRDSCKRLLRLFELHPCETLGWVPGDVPVPMGDAAPVGAPGFRGHLLRAYKQALFHYGAVPARGLMRDGPAGPRMDIPIE